MFVLSRDRQSPDHNEHKEQKKRERQRQEKEKKEQKEKEKRETEMKKKFKVMFLSFNPLVYQLSFRLGVQVFSTSVTF
jgi:hypothetical protein